MAQQQLDIEFDANNLYTEQTFSDRKSGTIRRLAPVTADGEPDSSRSVIYEGQASLMTPMGALPLNFELEADSLAQAIEKFPEEVNVAAERTIEELKEMQRQQSQKIQVPGDSGFGGMPSGGAQGGGRIQL